MQVKLNDRLVAPLKSMVDGIENITITQTVNKIIVEYLKQHNITIPSNPTTTKQIPPLDEVLDSMPQGDTTKTG